MQNRQDIPFPENFLQVYQAAKALDEKRLQELIDLGAMLDQKSGDGMYTAAGLLAAEQHHDAVLLLLKYGADPSFAAYGASAGNDVSFAELLRKTYGASPYEIARGVKNTAYADKLFKQFPGLIYALVFASTRVHADDADPFDDKQLLEIWLDQKSYPKPSPFVSHFYYAAKLEAMMQEQHSFDEIEEKVGSADELYPINSDEGAHIIMCSLRSAAAANYDRGRRELYFILDVLGDPDQRISRRKALLTGFAAAGKIAEAFEAASHWELPHLYRNTIITNAIADGHFNELMKYMGVKDWQHASFTDLPREYKDVIFPITRGLLLSGNVAAFQQFYCHFTRKFNDALSTNLFRVNLAGSYAKAFFKRFHFTHSPVELRNVAKMHQHVGPLLKAALVNHMSEALPAIAANMDKNLFLHTFAFMNLVFLKKLLKTVSKDKKPDLHHLLTAAMKIHMLMDKYHFNFDQALEFLHNRDLRGTLTNTLFAKLQPAVPTDVQTIILGKLTTLTNQDVRDMTVKYKEHRLKVNW